MPTTNPKVSGYIPQHLYDFFTAFCEERGVSMSKGVALLFAEYFGVDQSAVRPDDATLVTARLQDLEEKMSSLLSSPNNELLGKINDLSYQVEALSKKVQVLEESKPSSSLPSEPLIQSTLDISEPVVYKTEPPNELLSELPIEVKVFQGGQDSQGSFWGGSSSEPLLVYQSSDIDLAQEQGSLDSSSESEPLQEIKPIPGGKLSQLRFGLNKDTVSGKKRSSKTFQEFIEWTREKDPDGIAWMSVNVPSVGYLPAEELPSELKSKLLEWIAENIEPKLS